MLTTSPSNPPDKTIYQHKPLADDVSVASRGIELPVAPGVLAVIVITASLSELAVTRVFIIGWLLIAAANPAAMFAKTLSVAV